MSLSRFGYFALLVALEAAIILLSGCERIDDEGGKNLSTSIEGAAAEDPGQPACSSCCSAKALEEARNRELECTKATYEIPDLTLLDQFGNEISLKEHLTGDKPVVLNFFFATCTTICPVLAAGFSSFQQELGAKAKDVQFVSISIDPEHDTPEVLHDFGVRFKAGDGWTFLTGNREQIDRVMKAFDAYVQNKMDHLPLTFMHAPGGEKWTRINGLMSTADHASEYKAATGS